MSNLSELKLHTSYHKGLNNIAEEFYLPCVSRSFRYDRAVGFFRSTIYIIAWEALKQFIKNEGHIRLICSQFLSTDDINAIDSGYRLRNENETSDALAIEIERMINTSDIEKPTKVLASLVSLGIMEIQIAYVSSLDEYRSNRLFHDKLGIFTDSSNNTVVFKGSMNETYSGLSSDGNIESVDVYVSWGGKRDENRISDEIKYFESIWNNEYPNLITRPFPSIAISELHKIAEQHNLIELIDEVCEKIKGTRSISVKNKRQLKPHQTQALIDWGNNNRRGILEHSTGSGKTLTAIHAIRQSLSLHETPIILVPSELLLKQWQDELKDELSDLNISILPCGAGHTGWKEKRILSAWTKLTSNNNIILSLMPTAAKDDFLSNLSQGEHLFIVADEVHRLGSSEYRKILNINAGPRLGLSATPRRSGDTNGTDAIFYYFGGIVHTFSLYDAIKADILTPYIYQIHKVGLNDDEQERWDQATSEIKKYYAQYYNGDESDIGLKKRIDNMLINRARIVKNAASKVRIATQVIRDFYSIGQKWLVYCDNQNQLRDLMNELVKYNIESFEYHSAMEGDKDATLSLFDNNGGIVVSIKCLDEGVDIPSASHALILASSKNPREFIQRRGRILRKSIGKTLSYIHDCIVIPQKLGGAHDNISILEGELIRAIEFGENAENKGAVIELKRIALEYGLDYEKLRGQGVEDDRE